MDKIVIKGLRIFAYHGVNPEEKEKGQPFVLDITLYKDLSLPGATDDLNDTVNYSRVAKTATRVMHGTEGRPDRAGRFPCGGSSASGVPGSGGHGTTEKAPGAHCRRFRICGGGNYAAGAGGGGMSRAVVALGANLGDRESSLRMAVSSLAALPGTRVAACSHVYETDPVGYLDQPAFLNAALLVETELSPAALLGALLGIEAGLGRRRTFRNAPRVVDLDLLAMEDGEGRPVSSATAELQLPHPRMLERAFVLAPLSDLFASGTACGVPLWGSMGGDFSGWCALFCRREGVF